MSEIGQHDGGAIGAVLDDACAELVGGAFQAECEVWPISLAKSARDKNVRESFRCRPRFLSSDALQCLPDIRG